MQKRFISQKDALSIVKNHKNFLSDKTFYKIVNSTPNKVQIEEISSFNDLKEKRTWEVGLNENGDTYLKVLSVYNKKDNGEWIYNEKLSNSDPVIVCENKKAQNDGVKNFDNDGESSQKKIKKVKR